jgi:hypothetical protein
LRRKRWLVIFSTTIRHQHCGHQQHQAIIEELRIFSEIFFGSIANYCGSSKTPIE